ncbi:RMD1 family protein [Phenylobacterium sp.]|uniref:RMD1 family protein n=1 Tax=Phenylobacterium sp. TaxID=1871053 RepID=UPI0039C9739A
MGALAPDKLLVVADALAKSAALAQDERQVAKVFDTVEPWARRLAETGRSPGGRDFGASA